MQGIIAKYSQASQFLNGIGLNPDTHASTTYAPFNDTPILNFYRNTTTSMLVTPMDFDPAAQSSSPIIGLPQTNYTDFHVMSMKDDIEGGMDVSYYGPLQFGTPGQELTVSVDTGSADLWMPVTCPSCSNPQFAASASSTFHNSRKKVSLVYVRVFLSSYSAADNAMSL